ncbi:tkl protein kinase [Plasmopara halstedii]|uniref:Tkl protein kinase n=1 Tax=Plasmopara halstedii TaxID=4781 RepID=A0A0P1B001_PLAHL|nr:tkl protein kinase [Plasmopara halstedii]CEG46957.1 tkl protein kinase [Plasmopara halstedii]|eukprot:XP_024583326.1 tkl protein kinase [Plasmopara halstedii]
MGLVAFITCGSCARRRKHTNENFPETITIPTPSSQPHNAALAHHHAYDMDGPRLPITSNHHHLDGRISHKNDPRIERRTSTPQPRASTGVSRGPNRVSSGAVRVSSGPNRISNGPNRVSTIQNRVSTGQQRPRNGSHPNQPHPEQRPRRQQHDRNGRQERPVAPEKQRQERPVAPDKPRSGTGSGSSGNNRDLEITDRSKEVASKVLQEFQSDPILGKMRIPYSSLYFTRVLSKGAFGEVWLAQLENRQVAVKRILNEKKNDEKEIECFGAEIKLMASFSHPKIVEFLGVSWSSMQDVCAVTEYMGKGDLYGFLKRRQGQLNWRDHKIFLAEDVADALGYLHSLSPKVIHRDLKSKNILLDDSFRAKLSDFGISRERSVEDTMTAGVGTIYWTAPEVLMGKKYTEKADIFSFGIVMSELETHAVPYSDKRDNAGKKLQGMKIVQMVIRRNLRPTFSTECPKLVKELADRCLDSDPDARPSALELLRLIQHMQNLL